MSGYLKETEFREFWISRATGHIWVGGAGAKGQSTNQTDVRKGEQSLGNLPNGSVSISIKFALIRQD